MSADALRAYFIGLRRGRYSQEQVAQAAGMSRRAWIDYKKGRTHEIGATAMLSVLRFLNGSFDHLKELAAPNAGAQEGTSLAAQRAVEIAQGEVAALRASVSDDEFQVFLTEIDQEIRRVSKGLPRLRDLLRSRRARVDPDDDEPDQ